MDLNISRFKRNMHIIRISGSSHCGTVEMNPTRNNEVAVHGLAQWVKDPVLLWLWYRLAAVAPIQPLAWETPYATGALKKKKRARERERERENFFLRD